MTSGWRWKACGAGAQDYFVKGQYEGLRLYHALRYAMERKRLVTELEMRVAERTVELEAANRALQRDLAERKELEQKREEQELLITLMLNTGPSCIKRVAQDGTLLQMNQAGLRLIEACSEQEAVGLSVFELVTPEHRAAFVNMHHDVIGGQMRTLQFEIQGLKRARRWMETHAVPLLNPVTGCTEHLAVTNDITERKQTEEAHRLSEQRHISLINSVNGIVWEADPATFCFTFVSAQGEHLLGYPVQQWLNDPSFWPDHIHPADRKQAVAYCMEQTKLGLSHDFEYRMLAADGRHVWVRDLVSVVVEARRRVHGGHDGQRNDGRHRRPDGCGAA